MLDKSRNGQDFEIIIASLLEHYGIAYERQWVPGWQDPVGQTVRIDFRLHDLEEWPDGLCVEAKLQDSPGTAWQKIAYAIDSIKTSFQLPSILIVDGLAAQKAMRYARSKAGNSLQAVLTFMEFRAACQNLSNGTSKAVFRRQFDPDQQKLF